MKLKKRKAVSDNEMTTPERKARPKPVALNTDKPFYRRDPLMTALLTIFVFFVSQVGAGVLIAFYPALRNWTSQQGADWLQSSVIAQFVYILLAEVFAVWLIFWLLKKARIAKSRIGFIKPNLDDIPRALIAYVIYFAAYFMIITVASHFSHLNIDQPQKIGFESARSTQLYFVFASLVILPPIAEEIMFRGFLFTSLRQKFKLWHAVVLTSLLFGIAHLQFGSGAPLLWVAALDTFTLSCVLCTLREKSGSLWPGIYVHMLKNGIAFAALFHSKF